MGSKAIFDVMEFQVLLAYGAVAIQFVIKHLSVYAFRSSPFYFAAVFPARDLVPFVFLYQPYSTFMSLLLSGFNRSTTYLKRMPNLDEHNCAGFNPSHNRSDAVEPLSHQIDFATTSKLRTAPQRLFHPPIFPISITPPKKNHL